MLRFFSFRARVVRALLARRGATVLHVAGRAGQADIELIRRTHELAPMLVQDVAALQLLSCVRATRGLGGSMAEAGVLAGGTARLIAEAKADAPLRLFDVFETLQPGAGGGVSTPRADELRGHFGTVHGRQADVERLLAPYPRVHLHPGVFPDTTRGLEDERYSFVHVDLDLEASTRDALEYFHPRLMTGGVLLGDDYHFPGVRRAFDAFFASRADTRIELSWGQVLVVKG